ncbi:protein disulfide isomerase-like 1-2 [Panicum miliaceum]|uniref:protein disulfide-isomerase n=1 Tax=Panicum miliaceum TaxID=4540 RepID=A0A3L6SSE2_PANMI|nr:protein disulfide isomerase-like 1-2 [Panicum miliaceum]
MASSLLLPSACLALLLLLLPPLSSSTRGGRAEEAGLTLDAGNFSEAVAAHQFIVVNFYAPWCYWSKKLAPEYKKAAFILRNHDPPIVLAKIDASGKKNKDFREKYHVAGYPTIKLLRNGGSSVQEYIGMRDAESIVKYLKKQVGTASTEIKSAEDAPSSITDNNGKGKGKATAILFLRSPHDRIREFKDQFFEAAKQYSPKNIGFTMVDVSGPQVALQDGTLEPYHKSAPVPEVSDQPVEKVAAKNPNDVIFNSANKVLLELRERMKWACQTLVATIMEIFTKHG